MLHSALEEPQQEHTLAYVTNYTLAKIFFLVLQHHHTHRIVDSDMARGLVPEATVTLKHIVQPT